jgi:hypothetical protein
MKKRATLYIASTLAAALMAIFGNDYVDATDWIDDTEKRFRSLEDVEIEVVFHHTATSSGMTAKELCDITNSRFNLGCSYALSIHPNGKVVQMNEFWENTPSVGGRNSRVLSIAFVGNYEENDIPDIMIERVKTIKEVFDKFDKENCNFKIKGYYLHKDFRNTLCPGKYAEKALIENGIIR